jgi:hypothetical protein
MPPPYQYSPHSTQTGGVGDIKKEPLGFIIEKKIAKKIFQIFKQLYRSGKL